ncbi:MAG TPA: neutral/alkaline non-lysosomal ceramidase N-terminal domain-containing protein [Bryobacteraceae bacterium]|nr:neutral/alkaline non-lysosomal ceramidase N-terminal domain-containing protein [Bryobacteraceae bacterium]
MAGCKTVAGWRGGRGTAPASRLHMGGYGARTGVSQGVLDPLHAKVLVLEGKDSAVALVTMDLVSNLPAAQLDRIRELVKSSTNIEDVIFNVSHTHSGPLVVENPPPWQLQAANDIAAGIGRAWRARRPARIGIGTGSVRIGHNRLYDMSEGHGKMLWRDETRIPTSPVDPTVMVLRVDSKDGAPLAVVVNYACHAVTLGPENLQYSADYPGEMARTVEKAYPGAVCLFVQGGAGDINPYYDKTPLIQDAVFVMRETGRTLAREAIRTLAAITTHDVSDTELRIAREPLQFKARYSHDKVLAGLDLQKMSLSGRMHIEAATRGPYTGPVTTLLLGHEFAFVGVPCEIFVDFQMELRERVRDFPIVFGGYTNGNLGYVPTIRAAVDGGYGASQIGSYIEVGAGNRMIDAAVIRLGYWTDKLQSKAHPPLQ